MAVVRQNEDLRRHVQNMSDCLEFGRINSNKALDEAKYHKRLVIGLLLI